MDVRLPAELQAGLARLLQSVSRSALNARFAEISRLYRQGTPSSVMIRDGQDVLAYALSRMPATYAAVIDVLDRIGTEVPDFAPRSLLDIGAGPGTASWAAKAMWPEIATVTMMDHSPAFIELATSLAEGSIALGDAQVRRQDILALDVATPVDLVVVSYALTELDESHFAQLAPKLLAASQGLLVIIEPGTPRDYRRLMAMRAALIAAGARIVAPCPHERACPLAGEDWCHFSVRLPRSRDHMQTKDASLPYEDERFSYLVATTNPALQRGPEGRVIKPPRADKHSVTLPLCGPDGLTEGLVRSREKAAFKVASRMQWGDGVSR